MADEASRAKGEERREALAQINYLQQLYTDRHNLLAREMGGMMENLQEMSNALTSLNAVDRLRNRGAMMHLGSDVYTTGTVGSMERIIVGVGSNYLVEKSVDECKGFISARIDKYNKLLQGLAKEREDLEAALIDLSYKLESLDG